MRDLAICILTPVYAVHCNGSFIDSFLIERGKMLALCLFTLTLPWTLDTVRYISFFHHSRVCLFTMLGNSLLHYAYAIQFVGTVIPCERLALAALSQLNVER